MIVAFENPRATLSALCRENSKILSFSLVHLWDASVGDKEDLLMSILACCGTLVK